MGLGQCDHINRMITLSVITLSGFHCIILYLYTVKLGYNDLGFSELPLLANIKLSLVGSGDFPILFSWLKRTKMEKKVFKLTKTTFFQSESDPFYIA